MHERMNVQRGNLTSYGALLPGETDEDYKTLQPFQVKGNGLKDTHRMKKHYVRRS